MVIRLRASGTGGDARDNTAGEIVDEDVVPAVGVAGDEVGGVAHERHLGPVRREDRRVAAVIRLRARGIGGDARDRAAGEILDEDVPRVVAVAGDEVGGEARKGHLRAVRREDRLVAAVIRLRASGTGGDARGNTAGEVLDEDVVSVVGVAGDEVGCVAIKRHLGPVRREGPIVAAVISFCPIGRR